MAPTLQSRNPFADPAIPSFADLIARVYEVLRQLLGHKDIKTTISFYAGAEGASAARHYARTILEIRASSLGVEPRHG